MIKKNKTKQHDRSTYQIEGKIDRKTASMRVVVGFPKIKVWDEAGLHVPPPLPLCYLLALVLALKLQKLSWYSNSMTLIFCIKLWEYKMLNFHQIFNYLVVYNCLINRSEVIKPARCASWDLTHCRYLHSLHLRRNLQYL